MATDIWVLFPAQAGVILNRLAYQAIIWTFPRASGGDPTDFVSVALTVDFSPRKRG